MQNFVIFFFYVPCSFDPHAFQGRRGVEYGCVPQRMSVVHWLPGLVDVFHLGDRELGGVLLQRLVLLVRRRSLVLVVVLVLV